MKTPSNTSFLADSLKRKVIFLTGKGGVGKTSLAWAMALALSRHQRKVRLISWSPFDTDPETSILNSFNIPWTQLDPFSCFREYAIKTLKFEKILDAVFENKILKAFIDVAPGLSETVVAGKVWDLYDSAEQDTLIVDLPATGHALSFFKSPMGIEKMFASGFVHRHAAQICDMFFDPYTRLDVVTLPEEMPIVESEQFLEKVAQLGKFSMGFLWANQCTPEFKIPQTLPALLPADIQECVLDHQARVTREKSVLEQTHNFPLVLKKIPRFASEVFKDTVEQMAGVLEI